MANGKESQLFTASLSLAFTVSEGNINGEELDTEEITDLNEIFSNVGIDSGDIKTFLKWDIDTKLIEYQSHEITSFEVVDNTLNVGAVVKFLAPLDFDIESEEFDDHLFDLKNGILFSFSNGDSSIDMLQEECSVELID